MIYRNTQNRTVWLVSAGELVIKDKEAEKVKVFPTFTDSVTWALNKFKSKDDKSKNDKSKDDASK